MPSSGAKVLPSGVLSYFGNCDDEPACIGKHATTNLNWKAFMKCEMCGVMTYAWTHTIHDVSTFVHVRMYPPLQTESNACPG